MKSDRPKALLLHGWFSSGSSKSIFLHSLGFKVYTPQLSNFSFQQAVDDANEMLDRICPDLIMGISRGGAVALNIQHQDIPTVLLAPAWKHFGNVSEITNPRTIVVHSPKDGMVAYEDSVELINASNHGRLVTAGMDHRLNDYDAQFAVEKAINQLLPLQVTKAIPTQERKHYLGNFFEELY